MHTFYAVDLVGWLHLGSLRRVLADRAHLHPIVRGSVASRMSRDDFHHSRSLPNWQV